MSLKSTVLSVYAWHIKRQMDKMSLHAEQDQIKTLQSLIHKAQNTVFGKDHSFLNIKNYSNYKADVPIRDYESLKPYIQKIIDGEKDVLWPGRPSYFAKTSGTTSGVKYIPITKESMPNHIDSARNALFNFLIQKKQFDVFDGKVMFLSGSPTLDTKGFIPTGRLSGIVNHEIPFWVKGNQLPSYSTNCIEDWETKVGKVIEETREQDMRLISGIPPWVQMYFERLLEVTGKKTVREVFPNFKLFMFGGVNYEPYRMALETLIGFKIDSVEVYPASEGFIAFQDVPNHNGLLLITNSGIFYEFVPIDQIFTDSPDRLMLHEVELHKDYAIVINNNAGLWGYNLGDTVRFVSKNPYRLVVSGRVKHFISAFGEHVIGKEVEESMLIVTGKYNSRVTEFTVAPQVNPPDGGLPYHEWFIEFDSENPDLNAFAEQLDKHLCEQNIYYKDLIDGKILRPLKLSVLPKNSFRRYMKTKGKLGGQNKVPRLSNDRNIANDLSIYLESDEMNIDRAF